MLGIQGFRFQNCGFSGQYKLNGALKEVNKIRTEYKKTTNQTAAEVITSQTNYDKTGEHTVQYIPAHWKKSFWFLDSNNAPK